MRPFVKQFALYYQTVVYPVFDIGVLWPSGWMDQDETWHGGGLGLDHTVLYGVPVPPPQKKGAQPPNYQPMSVIAKNSWMDQDAP